MRSVKQFLKLGTVLVLGGLVFLAWTHVRAIEDWYKLRGYTPPAAVVSLASDDTMTPSATHIFYVNHPLLIADASSFDQQCTVTEQTIVNGCYHPDQNGIFIHDVKDPRLQGIDQVTAAHEMLHAAYGRLSSSERARIDGLIQDYYKNSLSDQRIIDTINSYKKTEPDSLVDEMHSIFGTEVASLPAPLETYYKQYFTNRAVVVGYADRYENEFTNRINQINTYDSKLTTLKDQITSEESNLDSLLNQIKSDRARLDALRSSNQIDAYNAGVASFNTEVDRYNAGVRQLQNDIAYYNNLVNTRNAVAAELRSLDQSLDTRLTAQSAQSAQ